MIGQKAIPFYRDGGVERHVEELATRLAKRGHQVTVFVRRRYVATRQDLWQGVNLVRVPEIPSKHLGTISSTLFATLRVTLGLKLGFFQPKPSFDVIHFHGVGPALASWIPRIFTRAKIVVTFHSIDRFHSKWGFFSRLVLYVGEWMATHTPHATIAVSHSIVQYCKKQYGRSVVYIPNGVSLQKAQGKEILARWGLRKGRYLLTVARLVKHKGIHHLIAAYKMVADSIKGEMKLVIVGAPSFTADYETYLKKLAGEDHRILFVGYQTGEALAELYGNAYIYVHPSEHEGLSLTILEAMSFGKCVLMSEIPENLEAIDHSGVSFRSGDADDLALKLTELLNHPEIVSERAGRAAGFIKRNFEWEKVVDETERLYVKLKKTARSW